MRLNLEQISQISGGVGTPGIQVSKTKSGKWRVSYTNNTGNITVSFKFETELEANRCSIYLIKQYSGMECGSRALEHYLYQKK